MAKNCELANDPDLDTRSMALERLAKSSVVGLYETKISVNVSTLAPEAVRVELSNLVDRINQRALIEAE